MNEIELQMMKGMVSILNEAKNSYQDGCPIMSDEQYDSRFKDLKQFEQEANFILLNSPTLNRNILNICLSPVTQNSKVFKELDNVDNIFENFNKKETVAYIGLDGKDTSITYKDGVITQIETNDIRCLKQANNIPYKIDKIGVFEVCGKVISIDDKLKFFVDEVVDDVDNSINNGLKRAKELGFDVVPNWFATSLSNSKVLQNWVNYIFDYAKEEELPCNDIIFRIDDIRNQEVFKLKNERGN